MVTATHRQRQLGHLRADLADRLGRPQLPEVAVPPEAARRSRHRASLRRLIGKCQSVRRVSPRLIAVPTEPPPPDPRRAPTGHRRRGPGAGLRRRGCASCGSASTEALTNKEIAERLGAQPGHGAAPRAHPRRHRIPGRRARARARHPRVARGALPGHRQELADGRRRRRPDRRDPIAARPSSRRWPRWGSTGWRAPGSGLRLSAGGPGGVPAAAARRCSTSTPGRPADPTAPRGRSTSGCIRRPEVLHRAMTENTAATHQLRCPDPPACHAGTR